MDVFSRVASDACRRGASIFSAFQMATATFRFYVGATKLIVGQAMVECFGIQFDDCCRPALVIGVAGFAVAVGCAGVAAMKALLRRDVGRHAFVTLHAKLFLTAFREGCVAAIAGCFVLGVFRYKFARTDELFNQAFAAGGCDAADDDKRQKRYELRTHNPVARTNIGARLRCES